VRLAVCFVAVALLGAGALPAQKKPPVTYVRPNLVEEIPNAAQRFGVAEKNCANYGWAVAVNAVLDAAARATLPQSYWVTKTGGGDRCMSTIDDPAALAKALSTDHVVGPGRRVEIRAQFAAGVPREVDALIVSPREGRPLIVLYDGRVHLLQGVLYDDHLRTYRDHYYAVKELRLIDPMQPIDSKQRTVVFSREKDDPVRIGGIFILNIKELQPGQLSDGYSN
jgi:hypothetical protein